MRITSIACAAAAALIFFPRETTAGPPELASDRAGELVKAEDYKGALAEANRQLERNPDDLLFLRIKAVALMELGDADSAVAVMRRAVKVDPQSVASIYYLAQALAYAGSPRESRDLLLKVRSMAPDSDYAAKAAEILPTLENLVSTSEAIKDDKRFSVTLRMGGEYDDNVPARANGDSGDTPKESGRFFTSAYIEVRLPDEKVDNAPVTLGSSYAIYQSLHEREALQAFDVTNQTASVFIAKSGTVFDKVFEAKLSGQFSDVDLGYREFNQSWGAEANLDVQWAEWAVLSPSYSIEWKQFANDTSFPKLFSRDGVEHSADVTQSFDLFDNKVSLAVGYTYRRRDTEGRQFESESHAVSAAAKVALPWRVKLSAKFNYQTEDYLEYTPQPRRIDDVYTYSVSVSRPLWWEELRVEIYANRTCADSRQPFASYERNIIGIASSYAF